MASNGDRDIGLGAKKYVIAMLKSSSRIISWVWRRVFRAKNDDYAKKLQYLSKEEAAIQSRMKRHSMTFRQIIKNLIVFSVVLEVIAIFFATTRSDDTNWQKRALRVLPMFLLPAASFVIYTTIVSLTRMLELKDKRKLESLQAERKAKIDELKEKTNYYATQQLIQKYDLDPAAKAAAATVLASKLGADSGLKVEVANEPKAKSSSNQIQPDGLSNKKSSGTRSTSAGNEVISQVVTESSLVFSQNGLELLPSPKIVEHYKGSSSNDSGWIARLAAFLVGEDPSQCFALICGNCHRHNGLARKEDFSQITYYCPHCHAMNISEQKSVHDTNNHAPAVGTDSHNDSTLSEIANSITVVKEISVKNRDN